MWSGPVASAVTPIALVLAGLAAIGALVASTPQIVSPGTAGGVLITPSIAAGIIAESARVDPKVRLTKRELEILLLVQRGKRNREIAREIGLEEKAVKNHINSIYSKLGLTSRVEAIATRLPR
jgi:two-component system nitrate/nitrite response regulator NarL